MSRLFQRGQLAPNPLLPARPNGRGSKRSISADAALRNSAVWACTRLRSNLISSLPVDAFRKVLGVQVEIKKPPVLVNPGGSRVSMREFLYSSQMDLDRVGNAYGIITETDGAGLPRRIDLVSHDQVVVRVKDDVVTYRIGTKVYAEDEIWHERQYTVPGLVMGLSPIAYSAWQLGLWQSSIDFSQEWFSNNGMIPSGHLKNTKKVLGDDDADFVKKRYKAAIEGGDIFVTGNDWEFSTKETPSADSRFMDLQQHTDRDVVRFFDVPGDLVEVHASGSAVTYANITQRNLQFLIMSLGPALGRREEALSRLLGDGEERFVKLNSAALLRMDPKTTSDMLVAEVAGKITAPSEARALMNRAPFTDAQLAEFAVLFPKGGTPTAPQTKEL